MLLIFMDPLGGVLSAAKLLEETTRKRNKKKTKPALFLTSFGLVILRNIRPFFLFRGYVIITIFLAKCQCVFFH